MTGAEVLAGVAERRAIEARRPSGEPFKGACTKCTMSHDNIHSHFAHGLCSKCAEFELEQARLSRVCCRCGRPLGPLPAFGGRPEDRGRFLACFECGLVLLSVSEDRDAERKAVSRRAIMGSHSNAE
jgi:hypothetical protein